ncbi:MAG: hypothetical protein CTY12_03215 [Methylotenera sp.]|nr:MAG: hypothetical protein CTY12_03215 [Methylotenera sp.]
MGKRIRQHILTLLRFYWNPHINKASACNCTLHRQLPAFLYCNGFDAKKPCHPCHQSSTRVCRTALGLLLAFLLWRKHTVTTLLQQQLQASNEELQRQKQQLEILSQLDALTGLYNRREFDRLANIELVRAKREGSDTAIIMADLDFFKRINDCFGHPTGDEVIQKTAEALSQNIRASDIVARIGGEEFIILLPKTSLDEALVVAEKLRLSLQENAIQTQISQTIQMTASFGVTAMATHQQGSLNALYAAADLALYAAKNKGRNRVESQNIS